ncbi:MULTISPECIES: Hsp20/alpha crystallin family protein [Rhodomicrobium]|uniref:Hsp20/alpha crystallin family protein n=1 Tax=Rhodomicrobium TaxID=1068 RepID=UPI00148255C3|nr:MULTISPECIES: Hsp20/alpha crystallin family protein [Rhodomicrobium]
MAQTQSQTPATQQSRNGGSNAPATTAGQSGSGGRGMQTRSGGRDPVTMLRSDIDRVLDSFWRGFDLPMMGLVNSALLSGDTMPINMRETDKEVEITAELPGFEPDEIDVMVTDGAVTIRAEGETSQDVSDNGYIIHERRVARFERTLPLPDNVDPEAIQASYRNGVLTLSIPKTSDSDNGSRRIAVQSS